MRNGLFNPKFLLFFVVITIIVIAFIGIYLIETSKINNNSLKGEADLKIKSSSITSDISANENYQKYIAKLNILSKPDLTKDEQLNTLENALPYIVFAYADTNDHSLYILEEQLINVMHENFPDKMSSGFKPLCYDPICSDHPQPREITDIINKIKESNLPQQIKDVDIKDFTNISYINDDTIGTEAKINGYLAKANDARVSSDYKLAGLNEEIYNDIINYLKNSYPDSYFKYIIPQR